MNTPNQKKTSNHQLTVFESAFVGTMANTTEALINYPLWTLKNRIINGSGFTLRPTIWYAGIVPYIIGTAPITSIQMGVNRGIHNAFFDASREPSNYQHIASAFVAGVTSAIVGCPTEMVVTQQGKFGGSFFSVGSKLIKQGGWKCLSTGFSNIAMREGIFTIGYDVASPYIKSKIKPYCKKDSHASIISGIGAGIPAAIASQANDTLKTIQQSANQLQPVRAIDAAKNIYATQGFSGFFKGGCWRGARVASGITIMANVKEKMEAEFKNQSANTIMRK